MIRIYTSLLLFILFANSALKAQLDGSKQSLFNQIYLAAEKEYGINQELINGFLFENKYQDAVGHPYLLNYYSDQGSVIYRGMRYSNLSLRYNLYDQQVLLIYISNGVEYKLHLLNEFISEFKIENKKFINKGFDDNENKKFYQVIGEDYPINVLYFWQKGLSDLYISNSDIKKFSSGQKETFILMYDKLISFNGNSSFARKFSSKSKPEIKKYIRKNNIKVKQANDQKMELLMEFINTLAK